jgi:hypothetical protein
MSLPSYHGDGHFVSLELLFHVTLIPEALSTHHFSLMPILIPWVVCTCTCMYPIVSALLLCELRPRKDSSETRFLPAIDSRLKQVMYIRNETPHQWGSELVSNLSQESDSQAVVETSRHLLAGSHLSLESNVLVKT